MGGSLGAALVSSSDPSRVSTALAASSAIFLSCGKDEELDDCRSCCCCFLARFFSNFSTFSKMVLRRSSSLSESLRASSIARSNSTAPGEGARLTLRPPSKSKGNTGIPFWLLEALRLFNSGCSVCPNGLKYRLFTSEHSESTRQKWTFQPRFLQRERQTYVLRISEGRSRMC